MQRSQDFCESWFWAFQAQQAANITWQLMPMASKMQFQVPSDVPHGGYSDLPTPTGLPVLAFAFYSWQ